MSKYTTLGELIVRLTNRLILSKDEVLIKTHLRVLMIFLMIFLTKDHEENVQEDLQEDLEEGLREQLKAPVLTMPLKH